MKGDRYLRMWGIRVGRLDITGGGLDHIECSVKFFWWGKPIILLSAMVDVMCGGAKTA